MGAVNLSLCIRGRHIGQRAGAPVWELLHRNGQRQGHWASLPEPQVTGNGLPLWTGSCEAQTNKPRDYTQVISSCTQNNTSMMGTEMQPRARTPAKNSLEEI